MVMAPVEQSSMNGAAIRAKKQAIVGNKEFYCISRGRMSK
jgi:hypothetical protein